MIRRRELLGAGIALLLSPAASLARAPRLTALPSGVGRALSASPFVYISPLHSNGQESTCHGEVWYAWLDGAVVINTRVGTWKDRSLRRGLDRARIWVGDYGTWKRVLGQNEAFRAGPSFVARASHTTDAELLDRLLESFDEKYPDEIGKWRDRMRSGIGDGSRVMIRYRSDSTDSSRT